MTPCDMREANRILLAWGVAAVPILHRDRYKYLGEPDGCRWPRQDGYACWGEVDKEELCWRHVDRRTFVEGEGRVLSALDRARRVGRRTGVYLIQGGDSVKIGKATDVDERLRALQTGSPVRLVLRRFVRCPDAHELERYLHRRLARYRQHGEWFEAQAVLADLEHTTDDALRAHAHRRRFEVCGSVRDLARFFGTSDGRAVLEALPLDVNVADGSGGSDRRQT